MGVFDLDAGPVTSRTTTNDREAYTLNNVTAKKAPDGSVTIQFGGCDGKVANCLPITPGWNTWCGSIVRVPRFWTARGRSRKQRRCRDGDHEHD